MCPITSLRKLFWDPCKSMWNSPVEVDLFSSAIFKVAFSCSYFGLFWIASVVPVFLGLIMATADDPASKKRKKDPLQVPTRVKITYPSDEQHWGRKLPPEHGKCF